MSLLALSLSWDPQLRGFGILLLGVGILMGSVYLLLSTNVGARLGLLIAITGLTGWMTLMGVVWTIYAQGWRGETPTWRAEEAFTGAFAGQSTVEAASSFPNGWKPVEQQNRIYGDAVAAVDAVLAPEPETGGGGHGGGSAAAHEPELRFASPFDEPTEYVVTGVWRKGGEAYFPGGWETRKVDSPPCNGGIVGEPLCRVKRKLGFLHKPHYVVVQVQPVLEAEGEDDAQAAPVGAPEPDPDAPKTTVVMIRDAHRPKLPIVNAEVGFISGLRGQPLLFTIVSSIWFGVALSVLHRRDKLAMAARAQEST